MFEYIPDYLYRHIDGFGDGTNFGDAEGDGYGSSMYKIGFQRFMNLE